jgi:DNA-binding CsgD family transcriptional regulator
VLSLVESAYSVDLPHRSWAMGLLRSMQDIVACDLGGFMCFWECPEGGQPAMGLDSAVATGVLEAKTPVIYAGLANAPPNWLRRILESVPALGLCALTSEVDPSGKLSYRSGLEAFGIADGVNLLASDLNHRGFLISLAITGRHGPSVALRRDLTRAITHILAALRLRVRLGATESDEVTMRPPPVESEAVLSPEGRLLHASGAANRSAARRELERAVRDIERARAGQFDTPQRALETWKGLVAARWSLVDSFEQDGRRYVLARENQPRTIGPAGLTPAECNVIAYATRGLTTKGIAYALGISDTTVRVLMMRAARRCGAKSRGELLKAWTRLTSASGDRTPDSDSHR